MTGNEAIELMIEKMADFEHQHWSGWMRYLFSKSISNKDGSVTIPQSFADHWKREMLTPYDDLSQKEQESDRIEARKYFLKFAHTLNDIVNTLPET